MMCLGPDEQSNGASLATTSTLAEIDQCNDSIANVRPSASTASSSRRFLQICCGSGSFICKSLQGYELERSVERR